MNRRNWLALLATSASVASGQPTPVLPAFDAASVRIHKAESAEEVRNGPWIQTSPGGVTMRNAKLLWSLGWAFDAQDWLISGPEWINSERYDIVAKAPATTPRDQLLLMLRKLMADRFNLKVHREKRQLRVYTLIVARGGPKMKAASGVRSNFTFGVGHVAAAELSMAEFADRLSGPVFQLGLPVIDSTGLSGTFDFTLDWSSGDAAAEAIAKPSLFTGIEEQLGLKLRPAKSQIDIWVVDHAERVALEN